MSYTQYTVYTISRLQLNGRVKKWYIQLSIDPVRFPKSKKANMQQYLINIKICKCNIDDLQTAIT